MFLANLPSRDGGRRSLNGLRWLGCAVSMLVGAAACSPPPATPPRPAGPMDLELARRYDRNGGAGPIAITADYLETVIVRA